jgi:hypothetical protein
VTAGNLAREGLGKRARGLPGASHGDGIGDKCEAWQAGRAITIVLTGS